MANQALPVMIQTNPATGYATALLATTVAFVAVRVLTPVLGVPMAYVLLLPAVAFSNWYCGTGPSVVASIVALAGLKFWYMVPLHSFTGISPHEAFDMLAFVVASATIIAMGESRRRENEMLRKTHVQLEDRVKERTSELDVANQGLRDLTAQLMQSQDDERRRIARELHDSVGQTLAALAMNLTTVGSEVERLKKTAGTIADSAALVEEMNKEVRTISYLLHPPLLDECGLESAVRWYIDGFVERSQIEVDLEISGNFGRYPRELEIVIFRTIQECLTNIHRHSGSPNARIRLKRVEGEIRLEIADQGTGMTTERLDEVTAATTPGVGLRGMRERVRQLGGSLEIHSSAKGTIVEARLPVETNWTSAAA